MVVMFRILFYRKNCTKFDIMKFRLKGDFRRFLRNHFLIQGSSMFKTSCYAVLFSFLLTLSVGASAADVKKGKIMLRNILNHETGRWILQTHKDDHCEYPLTHIENNTYQS